MGKDRKFKIMSFVEISHDNDFDLENRQERLRKALEKRRQAARTEASTSGSADTVTETLATSETVRVPDNKDPRKSKKNKKSKKPEAVKKN